MEDQGRSLISSGSGDNEPGLPANLASQLDQALGRRPKDPPIIPTHVKLAQGIFGEKPAGQGSTSSTSAAGSSSGVQEPASK